MTAVETLTPSPDVAEKNALGIDYNTAILIGRRLYAGRLQHSISTDMISKKIKIRGRYIEAIESGDWDILPPGLNGRGLIRLYAKELGVNLPEFDEFHSLATVLAERQSERLTHGLQNKKSRYQPAAEESAEIIRIVPRSQYRTGPTAVPPLGGGTLGGGTLGHMSSHTQHVQHAQPQHMTPVAHISNTPHIAAQATPMANNTPETMPIPTTTSTAAIAYTPEPERQPEPFQVLPLAKPVHRKIYVAHSQETQTESRLAPVEKFTQTAQMSQPTLAPAYTAPQLKFPLLAPVLKKIVCWARNLPKQKIILTAGVCVGVYGIGYGVYDVSRHTSSKLAPVLLQPPLQAQKPLQAAASLIPPPAAVPQKAVLHLLGKVKISVVADDVSLVSGLQPVGDIDLDFRNNVVIETSDASKLKISYGAFEYSELGWNEKKQRIVLNAKPYP